MSSGSTSRGIAFLPIQKCVYAVTKLALHYGQAANIDRIFTIFVVGIYFCFSCKAQHLL